jgi:hypothetical protein
MSVATRSFRQENNIVTLENYGNNRSLTNIKRESATRRVARPSRAALSSRRTATRGAAARRGSTP